MNGRPEISVLVTERIAATYGGRIRDIGRDAGRHLVLTMFPGRHAAAAEVAFLSRELIVGSTLKVFSPQLTAFFDRLQSQPDLDWVHLCSSGVDFPAITALRRRGVRLSTSSGANAQPMAQTALAGLLCLSRGMPRWVRLQARRQWSTAPEAEWPDDLAGQTVTIIGMGPIGLEIARLCKAIGLNVVAVRRRADELPPNCDEVRSWRDLDEIAPRTDWLVIAAPLTAETTGLVDRRILALLPPRAGVVNVGRGEIVDEQALIEALGAGRLLGAYLDVFAHEPLDPSSPLWDMSNVIISPHSAALSRGNEGRQAEAFLSNLAAYLRGKPLRNEVMPPAEADSRAAPENLGRERG